MPGLGLLSASAAGTEGIAKEAARQMAMTAVRTKLIVVPQERQDLLGLHPSARQQGQWVRVGHFGDAAEGLVEQLVKGSEVYIEGRLKMNTWQATDGTPRSGLNVTAWKLEVVGEGRHLCRGRRLGRDRGRSARAGSRGADNHRLAQTFPLRSSAILPS
jgi:single-stranded DNA-binding protein